MIIMMCVFSIASCCNNTERKQTKQKNCDKLKEMFFVFYIVKFLFSYFIIFSV